MSDKIIRDPLYNYISIDQGRDGWLIDLLATPEVQRLRRIHQLGVSNFTYPGAEHSRLSHSLGVLYLMQIACDHLQRSYPDAQVEIARPTLLAAALLHDVGHGPFSHLFELCAETDHEAWSEKIILSEESACHKALSKIDRFLPQKVAGLIDPENRKDPSWMKYLLSSQLDVDRLDYLRRDSFFSGAGYGHYDWFRILSSFALFGSDNADRTIVWPKKAMMAVEEYVFARYYMYQTVYLHKTTRGFEKMLIAMWHRARQMSSGDAQLIPTLAEFRDSPDPSISQYLAIEEHTVMEQVQRWTKHSDGCLSDLANRFMSRRNFVAIEPPALLNDDGFDVFGEQNATKWHESLCRIAEKGGYDPSMYCLIDEVKPKYHQPYFPEKEGDEQSAKNAIRICDPCDSFPIEISRLCPRLRPVTQKQFIPTRHFVPRELRTESNKAGSNWTAVE